MDPRWARTSDVSVRLPRTRGDGPPALGDSVRSARASPHTRGWTRGEHRPNDAAEGFPAHAGMDPSYLPAWRRRRRLPRTRGDGPQIYRYRGTVSGASPHTRGWTLVVQRPARNEGGFPAHAGMDPGHPCLCRSGMRLPRTRGDGPCIDTAYIRHAMASPHTRGWTRGCAQSGDRASGFPAHAGMDPSIWFATRAWHRLPRTRGDGPVGSGKGLWF